MAQVVRSWKMRIVSCTLLVICDSCEIFSMIDDLSALTVECRNVITRYLPWLQVPRLVAYWYRASKKLTNMYTWAGVSPPHHDFLLVIHFTPYLRSGQLVTTR
jgi:hypothetical protein